MAIPGPLAFVARRRARAAALSWAVPGFVLAAVVPVSSSAGVMGAVAPVIVGAVTVGSRISFPTLEELPLAAG